MRKMSWVVILWCAGIVTWIIGASVSGGSSAKKDCAHSTGISVQDCIDASNVGTGLGIAIILVVGFFGFVFLSLIWFMTKPKDRFCNGCGHKAKKGATSCPKCKYNFLTRETAS